MLAEMPGEVPTQNQSAAGHQDLLAEMLESVRETRKAGQQNQRDLLAEVLEQVCESQHEEGELPEGLLGDPQHQMLEGVLHQIPAQSEGRKGRQDLLADLLDKVCQACETGRQGQ